MDLLVRLACCILSVIEIVLIKGIYLMENTEQITIITTLRVDSSERQRNMDAVLRYLQPTGIRVLVLEADRRIFIRHGKTLRMLISVLCMTKTLSFIVHII